MDGGSTPTAPSPADPKGAGPDPRELAELEQQLDRWVTGGLLKRNQARNILAAEREGSPVPRVAPASESLIGLAIILGLGAYYFLVVQQNEALGDTGLALAFAVPPVATFLAGLMLPQGERSLRALADALWLLSVGLLLIFLIDIAGIMGLDGRLAAVVIPAILVAYAGTIYAIRRRAPELAVLFLTTTGLAGGIVGAMLEGGPETAAGVGAAILLLSVAWIIVGLASKIDPPDVAVRCGGAGIMLAPLLFLGESTPLAIAVGLIGSIGLIGLSIGRREPDLAGGGSLGVFIWLIVLITDYIAPETGVPGALAIGAVVLALGAVAATKLRRWVGLQDATPADG